MIEVIMHAGQCGLHFDTECHSCANSDAYNNYQINYLRQKLIIATEALEHIQHSMGQAKIVGNDVRREIALSLNKTADALTQIKEADHAQ